jgi:glycosyltransferase involved in cell wall biosynthesis
VGRNILQFTDSFHQGGSEGQALQLTKLLLDTGSYNVFLATLDGTGILRPEFEKAGLSAIREFPLTSFYDLNFVSQLQKCVRFIRENRIELVHSHGFYSNIFGMLSAFLARVPVRIASKRETAGIRTTAQQRVERLAYKSADAIIANARAVRNQLIDEGVPAEKIHIVYNGIDASRLPGRQNGSDDRSLAEFFSKFGLPYDEHVQVVSIVANFRLDVKDHPTFLRSARRVLEIKPNVRFLLAGEGPLLDDVKAYADSLGLHDSAFFLGQAESVAELLAVSDVCVLSSKSEGFSNSILEYMAAAKPVVVTDVGGAREMVVDGSSGYIVPVGDDEAMADRIISLLCQPDRANAMGEAGRAVVEQRFSVTERLRKTTTLYEALLRKGKGKADSENPIPAVGERS